MTDKSEKIDRADKVEAQIAALLAAAEPLRKLDDDDPRKEPLGKLVDEINRLRNAKT